MILVCNVSNYIGRRLFNFDRDFLEARFHLIRAIFRHYFHRLTLLSAYRCYRDRRRCWLIVSTPYCRIMLYHQFKFWFNICHTFSESSGPRHYRLLKFYQGSALAFLKILQRGPLLNRRRHDLPEIFLSVFIITNIHTHFMTQCLIAQYGTKQ